MENPHHEHQIDITASNTSPYDSSTAKEDDIMEEQVSTHQENENEKEKEKRRKKTSKVWEDMTEVVINGAKKAVCNHCHTKFTMRPGGPTTTLKRHIETCTIRKASLSGDQGKGPQQALLSFDSSAPEGTSLSSYKFEKEKVRDMFAKMIVAHEYPFMMAEHKLFILFCKALNPRYEPIRRHTAKDLSMKLYEEEKKKLKLMVESIGRISLTSDLWTSNQTLGYMSLTGHYLDPEWKLQKCLLNFCLLPPPHTGVAIADKVFECLSGWGIADKVSTITLDNASSNDAAVKCLKDEFAIRGELYFGGKIFHVRCCAHILNLLVQDGLNKIKEVVKSMRESVKHVTLTPSRLHRFNEIVKQISLPTHMSLILDTPTRWNLTYYMLSRALIFKEMFPLYQKRDPSYHWLPSDEDWERASKVCMFLEIFDDTTKIFSGVHYLTSNLFFPEVWKIRKILDDMSCDSSDYIVTMVHRMKEKFDKYWGECSLLMAISVVLDPRNKLKYIEYVFKNIHPPEEGDPHPEYLRHVDHVRKALYDLYAYYVSKEAQTSSGNVGSGGGHGSGNLKGKNKTRSEFEKWAKESEFAQPHKSEMDIYLEEGIFLGDDQFDVLSLWRVNNLKFQNLSKMARDILAIPTTIVASESAFSAGRRVLDDHRSSLSPETVEGLLCLGDWLRTEYGIGTGAD